MGPVRFELRVYETKTGRKPFKFWLDRLHDRRTVARVLARLDRLEYGHFGDVKSVGGGVSELRLNFGAGYRIYFGRDGERIILLLLGGDKGSQEKDIRSANEFWADYRRRRNG